MSESNFGLDQVQQFEINIPNSTELLRFDHTEVEILIDSNTELDHLKVHPDIRPVRLRLGSNTLPALTSEAQIRMLAGKTKRENTKARLLRINDESQRSYPQQRSGLPEGYSNCVLLLNESESLRLFIREVEITKV